LFFLRKKLASLPVEVVLPLPCQPTIIIILLFSNYYLNNVNYGFEYNLGFEYLNIFPINFQYQNGSLATEQGIVIIKKERDGIYNKAIVSRC
jgi:hypothetical protein